MKAGDAKKMIGKNVRYKELGWDWHWKFGVVQETKGKNILINNDWKCAPDLYAMSVSLEEGK